MMRTKILTAAFGVIFYEYDADGRHNGGLLLYNADPTCLLS